MGLNSPLSLPARMGHQGPCTDPSVMGRQGGLEEGRRRTGLHGWLKENSVAMVSVHSPLSAVTAQGMTGLTFLPSSTA